MFKRHSRISKRVDSAESAAQIAHTNFIPAIRNREIPSWQNSTNKRAITEKWECVSSAINKTRNGIFAPNKAGIIPVGRIPFQMVLRLPSKILRPTIVTNHCRFGVLFSCDFLYFSFLYANFFLLKIIYDWSCSYKYCNMHVFI